MNHSSTQASYDRLSRWYDWFSGSEKRFTRAGLKMLNPMTGQRILEIGCGTGHALAWLAEGGINVIGLDLSTGMLTRARQVLSRSHDQVALCQGDALRLPFPTQTFHAAFLSFTVELFPDPEIPHLLGEIHRVLRPEAQLAIVALRHENTLAVRTYDWFHRHWPQVVDCRPIHIQANLIQAGYEIHTSQRMSMWGLPVEILTAVRP